jgi:hypothetical protein
MKHDCLEHLQSKLWAGYLLLEHYDSSNLPEWAGGESRAIMVAVRMVGSDGKLIVTVTINGTDILALMNSGSPENYIKPELAKTLNVGWRMIEIPYVLIGIEGARVAQVREQTVRVDLKINGLTRREEFHIAPLALYFIVLGRGWLSKENPEINWTHGSIKLRQHLGAIGPQDLNLFQGLEGLLDDKEHHTLPEYQP